MMTLCFAQCLQDKSTNKQPGILTPGLQYAQPVLALDMRHISSQDLTFLTYQSVSGEFYPCMNVDMKFAAWKLYMYADVSGHACAWFGIHVCISEWVHGENAPSLSPHYLSFTTQASLYLWSHLYLWLWINKPQHKQESSRIFCPFLFLLRIWHTITCATGNGANATLHYFNEQWDVHALHPSICLFFPSACQSSPLTNALASDKGCLRCLTVIRIHTERHKAISAVFHAT